MGMFDQLKDVMDKARDKAQEMAKRADSATGGKLSDAMDQAKGAVSGAKNGMSAAKGRTDKAADTAGGTVDSGEPQTPGDTRQWYGSASHVDDPYHSEPN